FEKACAFTCNAPVTSPLPRIFTGKRSLRISPASARTSGVIGPSTSSSVRRPTLTVSHGVAHTLVKPRSYGIRCCVGSGPPSQQGGPPPPDRAFWPLVPRPAVLPRPLPLPRPRRGLLVLAPPSGRKSSIFIGIVVPTFRSTKRVTDYSPEISSTV